MKPKIEQRDGHDFVISPAGIRILLSSPIAALIDEGFTPERPRCLHWLVFGGTWSCYCYRSDTNRRAPFPCRLPIGGDWHHPSAWAHWDGRRVLYLEPYGLSASSASLLSRFAVRHSLALEIAPCLRKHASAIGVRIESQGGRLKRPRLSIERQAEMWRSGLWEWELESLVSRARQLDIRLVLAGRQCRTAICAAGLAADKARTSHHAAGAVGWYVYRDRPAIDLSFQTPRPIAALGDTNLAGWDVGRGNGGLSIQV